MHDGPTSIHNMHKNRSVHYNRSFQVRKAVPNNADAKQKYDECQKLMRKIAFEKAISVDDTRSIADSINVDAIGYCFFFHFSFTFDKF